MDNLVLNYVEDVLNGGHNYYFSRNIYDKEYYDIVGNKIIVDNKLAHNNYVNKFINFYNKAGKMYDDMNIYNSNISRKLNKQEFVFMDFLKKDLDLSKKHLDELIDYVEKNENEIYIKYYLLSYLFIFKYRIDIASHLKSELLKINSKDYPFTIGMLQLCQDGHENGDLLNDYPSLSKMK